MYRYKVCQRRLGTGAVIVLLLVVGITGFAVFPAEVPPSTEERVELNVTIWPTGDAGKVDVQTDAAYSSSETMDPFSRITQKILSFPVASDVTVTAVPNNGYEFLRFQILEGTQDQTVEEPTLHLQIEKKTLVSAHFQPTNAPFALHIDPLIPNNPAGRVSINPLPEDTTAQSNEVISLDGLTYPTGTVVHLSASSYPGWRFLQFEITKQLYRFKDVSYGGTSSRIMHDRAITVTIDAATTVVAKYVPDTYTLQVLIDGEGIVIAVPVEGSSPPVTVRSSAILTYPAGTEVELTAIPKHEQHWPFSHWDGDVTGTANPCSVTMDGNKSTRACFENQNPHITLKAEPADSGSISMGQAVYYPPLPVRWQVEYDEDSDLQAKPMDGYVFSHWSGDLQGGRTAGLQSDYLYFIMGSVDRTITAHFVPIEETDGEKVSWTPPGKSCCNGLGAVLIAEIARPGMNSSAHVRSEVSFESAPLFLYSDVEIALAPTIAGSAALESNLDWDWLSASGAVQVGMFPLEWTSAGAFVDVGIPRMVFGDAPLWFDFDASIGWGPQWNLPGGLSHAARVQATTSAIWETRAPWGTPIAVTTATDIITTVRLPNWRAITEWDASIIASSILPLSGMHDLDLQAWIDLDLLPWFMADLALRAELQLSKVSLGCQVTLGGGGLALEVSVAICPGLGT